MLVVLNEPAPAGGPKPGRASFYRELGRTSKHSISAFRVLPLYRFVTSSGR